MTDSAEHWNFAYAGGGRDVSWFQGQAAISDRLIKSVASAADTPIIDIGGGASTLVDGLLAAGFNDLSVLDVSSVGLAIARERLGDAAEEVEWFACDVLDWQPSRRYGIWHDRAVLHFSNDDADRARYRETLLATLRTGGHAVIGVFAQDGPERCSELQVRRHSQADLAEFLGEEFAIVDRRRELHRTPGGNPQPFNWVVARRV
ncbi:MAG: class I SAM-dependent methyltransferase [Actinobacteria bacterium]|nr:class I SAM-dependent methyltransferase [Actinomycetota bacterium]